MRIGIDLGGTKIEGVVLDRQGAVLAKLRKPTPAHDYQEIIGTLQSLVMELEAAAGRRCVVGIGSPGATSPFDGLLRNSNTTCMNGKPFLDDVSKVLDRPTRLANDANCFTLSEAVDGAGTGADVVFGVIIGTGVGGGLVVHGRLLVGVHGIAGEWGHNPLPWPTDDERPGAPCYCGRLGCIETFLSGPGLQRDHLQVTGERFAALEIARQAADGQPDARSTLERYAERMARALASIINVVDPDVIVLGGGLSNIDALYSMVPERWSRFVFSERVVTRLVPPVHGDSSGVRGAAWLWPADHE